MAKEGKKKGSKLKIVLIVLVVLIVIGAVGSSGDDEEADDTTSSGSTAIEQVADDSDEDNEAAESEEDEEEETVEVETVTTYEAGGYRVGTDIPAGEYKLTCTSSVAAYYEVYPSTTETELTDILINENFEGCTYVSLSDGQYLEVTRATFVAVEDAEPTTDLTLSGTYKVGLDIEAGEYKLTVDESSATGYGYYAVLSSVDAAAGSLASIIKNDNFEGSVYVTVEEGQYLNLSLASAELA